MLSLRLRVQYSAVCLGEGVCFIAGGSLYTRFGFAATCWFGFAIQVAMLGALAAYTGLGLISERTPAPCMKFSRSTENLWLPEPEVTEPVGVATEPVGVVTEVGVVFGYLKLVLASLFAVALCNGAFYSTVVITYTDQFGLSAADPPPFNNCFVELLGTRKYGYDLSH